MKHPNRAYRGSGCVGTRPVSRLERWAMRGKPVRGRGSGRPFEDRPHIAGHKQSVRDRRAKAQRMIDAGIGCIVGEGRGPHPTKRGPGRYA